MRPGRRQATAFKVNVYVAALYVDKTSTDPKGDDFAGQAKERTVAGFADPRLRSALG
jgi:hypothetical protein